MAAGPPDAALARLEDYAALRDRDPPPSRPPPVQGGGASTAPPPSCSPSPLQGKGRGGGRAKGEERERTLRRPRRRMKLADKQHEKCRIAPLDPLNHRTRQTRVAATVRPLDPHNDVTTGAHRQPEIAPRPHNRRDFFTRSCEETRGPRRSVQPPSGIPAGSPTTTIARPPPPSRRPATRRTSSRVTASISSGRRWI